MPRISPTPLEMGGGRIVGTTLLEPDFVIFLNQRLFVVTRDDLAHSHRLGLLI